MWEDQGGNILDYSYFLINEARNNEEYIIECENVNKRKIIEFSSLWILSIVILIVLRFSLNNFYDKLTNLLLYKILIFGFYIVILLSLIVMINKITSNVLKGEPTDVTKK